MYGVQYQANKLMVHSFLMVKLLTRMIIWICWKIYFFQSYKEKKTPHQCLLPTGYGSPIHFSKQVRAWFDEKFDRRWFGRGGPISYTPRFPDLTPWDFLMELC